MHKSLLKFIAAAGIAAGLLAPAQATVLTFEDVVPASGTIKPLTVLYAGFTWVNVGVVVGSDFSGQTGLDNSVVSGTHSAANPSFGESSFSSTTAFSFNSGYFEAFDVGATLLLLTVSAFLNGNLLGAQTFAINNVAPSFLQFDQALFGNVDKVSFSNAGNGTSIRNAVAFDDLTVNAAAAVDVPEPASVALLGLGLLGLAGVRRQRKG